MIFWMWPETAQFRRENPWGVTRKMKKTTDATIRGLEKASEDVAEISARALKNMDALVVKNQYLNGLLKYLIHREK